LHLLKFGNKSAPVNSDLCGLEAELQPHKAAKELDIVP
jgi:hypothetical protein